MRVVNSGYRSITDNVLPILFQCSSRYRQYFPVQVSHAVSAILFLVKNPIFIRYFFLKQFFLRLDSFFDLDIRDVRVRIICNSNSNGASHCQLVDCYCNGNSNGASHCQLVDCYCNGNSNGASHCQLVDCY